MSPYSELPSWRPPPAEHRSYNIFLQFVVRPWSDNAQGTRHGRIIKRLVVRPLAGVFELRGLVVKGDTATTFATIEKLRCTTTGALGTLSLAGPQTFSFGMHVPWVVGFRGKMIEHVAVEGCTVVVDEGNGAFWKRRDARLKAKSAAKKRRVLEKELRWRLLHVDDKDAVRKRLELLRSLDGEDSESDDEHEAYMESAAADWDAAEASPGKQSYAERLQAARERVKARVAARVQARAEDQAQRELQEDLSKTCARSDLRSTASSFPSGRWRSSVRRHAPRQRCASTTPCVAAYWHDADFKLVASAS